MHIIVAPIIFLFLQTSYATNIVRKIYKKLSLATTLKNQYELRKSSIHRMKRKERTQMQFIALYYKRETKRVGSE